MKTKTLLTLLVLIFFMGSVSATNLEDMNFNIPSGFEKVDGAEGLQFVDESKDVRIRIFDSDLHKYDNGFEEYNETVLVFDESTPLGDYDMYYTFVYGEYIKIDGKEYWVEVGNDDIKDRNADNCLETLEYFNEHNNFEWA